MEHNFYEMYLEELKEVTPCSREEDGRLLERWVQGDGQARNRLVEGHLKQAAELAKEYESQEQPKGCLPIGDLIQEANMALLTSLEEFREEHSASSGRSGGWDADGFMDFVEERIRQALQDALREQAGHRQTGEELAARVNVLQEVSRVMAGELGREATVEELAQKMKMTQEEIRGIMKMTLDAISVNPEPEA